MVLYARRGGFFVFINFFAHDKRQTKRFLPNMWYNENGTDEQNGYVLFAYIPFLYLPLL